MPGLARRHSRGRMTMRAGRRGPVRSAAGTRAGGAGEPAEQGPCRRASRPARLRPRAARHGREPESPAEPGRRVAGRVALGQAVRRIAAAAQAAAPRSGQDARRRRAKPRRDGSPTDRGAGRARRGAASGGGVRAVPGAAARRARDVRSPLASISRIGSTTRRWPAACGRSPTASQGLPRMVRDLARSLGQQVKLEIVGGATQVDRDILAKLDAPLGHLLRNAVDHGIESPDERAAAGKPAEGVVRVEARHSAGALQIIVSDDGRGVDLEKLRDAIVARNLTTREAARALSEAELLEFLFLPGFTMKDTVTDVSGRGVGLDAVQDMVKQVRGTVRVSSQPRQGHALPAAAAGDALRRPHAAGGDRRRALRLSARLHRPHAQAVEGQDRAARRPPAFRVRRPAHRPRHRAPGVRRPTRRPRPATSCR